MINSLYERFRHWSEKGSVWLYSDPHFDDSESKMIDLGWPSALEQVGMLKDVVHKNDTLVILGDLGDSHYLDYIKGYKVTVLGNHDDKMKNWIRSRCDEVYEGPLFIGEKILLSHEPIYGLNFCMNIHGHCHGQPLMSDQYHFNVCSDVINWTPVSLGELIKRGLISKIPSIHRITIDGATERKNARNSVDADDIGGNIRSD